MAVKNQTASQSQPKSQKPDFPASENLSSLLNDIDTILAISALKYFSTKEKPLSIRQISDMIYNFRNPDDNDTMSVEQWKKERDSKNRKISRKLNDLISLGRIRETFEACCDVGESNEMLCYEDLPGESAVYCPLADLLCLMFGGIVRCTEAGVQKFYFQPMISPEHIDMIKSCLMANQYFTEKESAYLIRAVESLGITQKVKTKGPDDSLPALTDCIRDRYAMLPNKKERLLQRSYPLLNTISQLYNAITEGRQIEMRLGSYQKGDRFGRVALTDSYPEKPPYHLNPYAIFFSDGHHYLIATKTSDTAKDAEQERVMHFRVDRILSVTRLQTPCEPKPDSLRDYWKNELTGFDQQLYSQMHPTMAYFEKIVTKKASLQTKHPIALSIIVDAFGKENVHIVGELPLPDSRASDISAKPQLEIVVYAQEDNIVRFCSQQHALVRLLRPASLAKQVVEALKNSLADYADS